MKIGKISLTILLTSFFVLIFSSSSFAKTKEGGDSFLSHFYHPDWGYKNIYYTVHTIEEYYVYTKYDEVELDHHHAVAIGKTSGYPYSLELYVSGVYKDDAGTIGKINASDWRWRDRLTDYITDRGETVYGGGNTKTFYSTVTDRPKVTFTSGAVADGIYYGSTDEIRMSLY
ncbi:MULTISPECIES: hypothetical protein [Brevibacillus]|jgi:hypothetical protein|uniref:hypothetical protein n=2 Tax=Brevibacillus TaxID=55080 RepID=UPI000F076730|nr:hypothetical protein [Brevibacillus borstelensis]MBE5396366.1 hypothetical protein [Brevibacillus borstelensis]MCM3594094.1 hypothetical protein [Brevibacillus borstelensis]MED1855080.1 hypothetical protein [Brevibacillus borstelensis]MED1874068.1 hypothetical protein [Brevibacillus borstelensis]MED1882153.1 hypothetical protein [Brevibacillus borstelensis]